MELLRSIMVPDSRSGLTRRIVLAAPDQPAPLAEPIARPNAAPKRRPASPTPPRSYPSARMPPVPSVGCPSRRPSFAAARTRAGGGPGRPPPRREHRLPHQLRAELRCRAAERLPFIDRIAELLREQSQVKLQVEGHTDALGSDAYNLDLSQRRAAAVANYLVDRQGIEATRLVVLGMGEGAPLVENGYDPRNRRVQFARVD